MTLMTLAQSTTAGAADSDTFFLWGCILFGVAVVLLFIELLVPSGGLLGILCGIAGICSVVAFFQYDSAWGIGVGLAYLLLTPIAIIFGFKFWLHSPMSKVMILGGDQTDAGLDNAANASEAARIGRLAELRALIGAEGIAETAMRPVGTVRIENQRIDGMAESGVIQAGTPIVVTDVYDNQVKVRPR